MVETLIGLFLILSVLVLVLSVTISIRMVRQAYRILEYAQQKILLAELQEDCDG